MTGPQMTPIHADEPRTVVNIKAAFREVHSTDPALLAPWAWHRWCLWRLHADVDMRASLRWVSSTLCARCAARLASVALLAPVHVPLAWPSIVQPTAGRAAPLCHRNRTSRTGGQSDLARRLLRAAGGIVADTWLTPIARRAAQSRVRSRFRREPSELTRAWFRCGCGGFRRTAGAGCRMSTRPV
jgi:hypothetical protein